MSPSVPVPEKQLTVDLRRFLARKPQTKVNQKTMMIPLLNCSVKFVQEKH